MVVDATAVTTSLLTLLNASISKSGKRKFSEADFVPAEKLNRRKSARFSDPEPDLSVSQRDLEGAEGATEVTESLLAEVEDFENVAVTDTYELHFGANPTILSESTRALIDSKAWTTSKVRQGQLGTVLLSLPKGVGVNVKSENDVLERLKAPFKLHQANQHHKTTELQNDLLSSLSLRHDLYLTTVSLDFRKSLKEATALHAINHVTKKRRRVLKNNERLAQAAKTSAEPPVDVQDQGFTRPSVLFLLPFRSTALDWFSAIKLHTPPPTFQIENHARFTSEYSLPPTAVDKLAEAEPGTYPRDHVETFKGNIDDNFRIGIKLTRKSVKLFSEFYNCDIIFASPLALRRSIEKDKNADYLSSIEILVIDQLDTLSMQNWEHVKFVLSYISQLPKESHDTDFSRVKPWYLDGHAAYLRQSILFAAYETAEGTALYNSNLRNVAGKAKTQRWWPPIEVPENIDQNFMQFDCVSPKDEPDKRFNHFTTQLLSVVLKSAVQSANTVVFIPSSFDFIRVQNYFKKHAGVSFAVLSEYSTNQDISRARQAFFQGTKSFLLISERFHFYRRYKIRGIRNLIFYGPPDHPQFFTELLSYPFLDEGVEGSDVTCRVLYSKYDWFRLERIAGTEAASAMLKSR